MSGTNRCHRRLGSGIAAGALLLVIVLASIIPYRHLIGRGFTDPDDFYEVYRAYTVDLPEPSRMVLEPHEANRYRPVNRLVTAASTAIGGGTADAFLVRNLLLHLINVGLVFGISLTLASNLWSAAVAASLFALHPANVNAVSTAVFTQVFSTSILLCSLCLLVRWWSQDPPRKGCTLALVSVLLTVVTFSSEMYLWVLPTYLIALLFFRGRIGTRRARTGALVLAAAGLVGYLLIRQVILGQQGLPTLHLGDRYGLRTPAQAVLNLAMFLVSSGISLDYLHFIDPAVQTLPTSPGTILASPGILISLALGLLFTTSTLVAGVLGFAWWKRRNLRLALAFSFLFLVSVSVVLVTTSASETHLYTSNAFLSISAGLVLCELGGYLSLSNRPLYVVGRWLLVGLILLVLLSRAFGVENRNQVLSARSGRSQKLQQQLASAVANCQGDEIVITSACQLPQGYSVYGGTGMELFQWPGFVQLSLDDFSLRTEVVALAGLETGEISLAPGSCVLVVDMEGNIYRYPETRSEWKCE